MLTGLAAPRRAQGLQGVVCGDGTQQLGVRLHGQNGWCAPDVVRIAVAQHQHVQPRVQGLQKRHQHAVPGIALQAVAGPGVVQHGMPGGAHQYSIALPYVSGQQFKRAGWRNRSLPEQYWQ